MQRRGDKRRKRNKKMRKRKKEKKNIVLSVLHESSVY